MKNKNPFISYMNTPNIKYVGTTPRFMGKITGHLTTYDPSSVCIICDDDKEVYLFRYDEIKIILRPYNELTLSEVAHINKIKKGYDTFDINISSKIIQYCISIGIDVGLIQKKYIILT